MSLYTLHEYIKIDRWSEFKAVYHEVKAIADTVRTEYRRVNKPFTSTIVVHEIKAVIAPISRIFNYRYRDEKLRELLTSAVQALHRLALEIESFYETRFVAEFRRLATILVSFLAPGDGVQLTIFDAEEYHDPKAAERKLPCFREWYNAIMRQFRSRTTSTTVGFSYPYRKANSVFTQLSIPHLFHRV